MHLTRRLGRALALAAVGLAPFACAQVVPTGNDAGPGTDAFFPGLDAGPGTDAFMPPGTDATPPGTDAGPGFVPPPSDGVACAPAPCPLDAPQCVGPDVDNAYCRAACDPLVTPDECGPTYACVDLTMGGGACLPAAIDEGCCNVCGCQAGLTCVNLMAPNGNVCLTDCVPGATPSPCEAGETCVPLMGGAGGSPGACLNTVSYPSCSGNPIMEQSCI